MGGKSAEVVENEKMIDSVDWKFLKIDVRYLIKGILQR